VLAQGYGGNSGSSILATLPTQTFLHGQVPTQEQVRHSQQQKGMAGQLPLIEKPDLVTP
jgi:hypothetical protein